MSENIRISPSREELSTALAKYVAQIASQAIAATGLFTIALSGGSLTQRLAQGLLAPPVCQQIEWPAWNVFWADERCVPFDNTDSNSGTAIRQLLQKVNIPDNQIHAIDVTLTPSEAAKAYHSTLAEVFNCKGDQIPRFDLILLGIGEDGHTASLFPEHPLLKEEQLWVAPIFDSPKPPANRVTLTLPLITNARNIAFVAAGENKSGIISKILGKSSIESKLPAQLVKPIHGELSWFMDNSAAAKLKR